jgi:hypothetical protein
MPTYRFYFYGPDEQLTGEESHHCAGDDSAVRMGEKLLAAHAVIVVCCGRQLIKRLTRRTPQAPP